MLRHGDFELAGRVAGARRRGLRRRERVRRPRAHHARARARTARSPPRASARPPARTRPPPPPGPAGAAEGRAVPRRRPRLARRLRRRARARRARTRLRRGGARRAARGPRRRAERTLALAARARRGSPSRCRAASIPPSRCCASARGSGDVVGLTLRLWIDEQAPDAERACCSPGGGAARARELPRARAPARHARRPRGLPPRRRRAVRGRLRARRDPESVHDLQRLLPPGGARRRRRAARGAARRDRATTRASSSAAAARSSRAAPTRRRISRTCSRACRRSVLARLRLPLGDATQGRRAGRGGRRRHGRGHGAREPGRLLPRRRRARRLPRARGRAARTPAASATRPGTSSGATPGAVAYTPGQRRGLGVAAPTPLYVLRADAARNELVVGPRSRLACSEVLLREARARRRARRACTPSCAARSPTVAARVERVPEGLRLRLDEPVYGVAAGQTAALYDDDGCVVGSGVIALAEPPS